MSIFCRQGFGYKKGGEVQKEGVKWHSSWKNYLAERREVSGRQSLDGKAQPASDPEEPSLFLGDGQALVATSQKRVGFLFDSTLTAFLMMGNLSPGLKNHAVTMFEVGKLADESLDSFLSELSGVCHPFC